MSGDDRQDLMQSPYGDDDVGDGEIPWKPPVVAAMLGALLMAIYVIFAVVTGPSEEPEVVVTTPDGESIDIVQDEFPVGYAAVSPDVALRADVVSVENDGTTVYVSSVVRAGAGHVEPVEVATWSLLAPEGAQIVGIATESVLSPGGTTIQFDSTADMGTLVMLASLPGEVASSSTSIDVDSAPVQLVDYEILGDGFKVVIDELQAGESGGTLQWHLVAGIAARVDVVVTINLRGSSVEFMTPYNPLNEQVATVAQTPTWALAGRSQLIGDFDASDEEGHEAAVSATIEFTVSVVTELGDTFEIPVSVVVQR